MGVEGIRKTGKITEKSYKETDIFPRLEKTREIAVNVKKIFGIHSTCLSSFNASEENIRNHNFQPYKYIIFGTHGILDNSIPWIQQPALVLTQFNNKNKYDGFLTMSEVMELKIPAEFVILTACETGIGENISGEGVMGMGRAFQYAGCETICMSLWEVSEDATVALTNSMINHLKSGEQ